MSDMWWLAVHVVAFVVSGGVFTLIAYFTMVGIVEDKSPWELWREMRDTEDDDE